MPATLLGPAVRFSVRGNLKARWIPKASMPDGVLTLAILDGASAIELTPALAAISGFSRDQGDMPAPDINSMDTPTVPGEITRAAASMTFYLSKDGNDVRTVLVQGDEGYVVLGETGFAVGDLVDIWPSEVKYGMKVRDDIARVTIPFTTGVAVQENVPVPAA